MERSWTDVQGGNWSDPDAWSPNGAPGSSDTAVIGSSGTYSVLLHQSASVGGLVLDDPDAVLLVEASGTSGTELAVADGATLDAGTLDLAGSYETLLGLGGSVPTIYVPVTLDISGGIVPGSGGEASALVSAAIADLDFTDSQTLDDVTLDLGNGVAVNASPGTLTLGPGVVLQQTGSLDSVDGSLVNLGLVDLSGGPSLLIGANQPGNIVNQGTIVTGAEDVVVAAQAFDNAGLIRIGGEFDLNVAGAFANTGTIALGPGAIFGFTADTTLNALGSIANVGGTLGIGGTLDLAGGTLAIAQGGAFADVALSGTLRDGTIQPDGGTLSIDGGTFDAVTYAGTLDLANFGSLVTLAVADGISVEGGTIDATQASETLQFLDTETLDHITINLGGSLGADDSLRGDPTGKLALGPDALLNTEGAAITVSAGALINQGSITVETGELSGQSTSLDNVGAIAIRAGAAALLQAEALANSGTIAIGAGGRLTLQSVTFDGESPPAGFTNTGTITVGNSSELVLDTSTTLAGLGTIGGSGATLDIAPGQTWFASHTEGVLNLAGGTLVIGGASPFRELLLGGTVENGTVVVEPGGTVDPLPAASEVNLECVPCYLAGSRLATLRGDVAVEDLAVGDELLTSAGRSRPVVWIGEREIDCRRTRRPDLVWPVRVRADAFAPGQPRRDLFLSPDHAVSVASADGGHDVLIPIKHLINGLTVVQEPAPSVHYFHVELETHDVLLADGLPAESFLETGNRGLFANGSPPLRAKTEAAGWRRACAPLRERGPDVAAARERLTDRAANLGWDEEAPGGLHVLTDRRAFAPASVKGRLYRFILPAGTQEVVIVSPSAASRRSGVWRRLGLGIGAIVANGGVIPLDSPRLAEGFLPAERGPNGVCRWTDGAAKLSLAELRGPVLLEVLVQHAAPSRRQERASTSERNVGRREAMPRSWAL